MMKLLSAPPSPFGRKVKITAKMKGLASWITIENVDTMPSGDTPLSRENPLGKIPVLILDDGTQIYDSAVICEYLDSLKPAPALFPANGPARYRALTLAALSDGIMEAALALVYEKRFRPEDKWVASWMERQNFKIDNALDHLEPNPPAWAKTPDYGHITLAAALGYLDFRLDGRWRQNRPQLAGWLTRFAAEVPAFDETKPPA